MASYTLHGNTHSTCACRVLVSAGQMGANVKLVNHEFTEISKPEWAEHQPFNQMPYLVNDQNGFQVFESRAIAKYLAVASGSDLVPKQSDVEAYAIFEQGCSVEQSDFDPAASGLAFELVFSKLFGLETDQKRVEKLKGDLSKRLKGYERLLSKQKFVGGDKLTLADLFHLPYGKMVVELGVAPSMTDGSLPHVKAWWETISNLPAWQNVVKQQGA